MNPDIDIVTFTYEPESFAELIIDLTKEIEVRNYRVTRIYDIDNILDQTERGLADDMTFEHYKIVEFCNLNSCAELISANLLAGVFMPVKFVAYRRRGEGGTHISFLRPRAFAHLFDSSRLRDVADKLDRDMHHVLEQIAF